MEIYVSYEVLRDREVGIGAIIGEAVNPATCQRLCRTIRLREVDSRDTVRRLPDANSSGAMYTGEQKDQGRRDNHGY